ncbi:1044_t:CDS:2 [Dentiscutata erythropus]|uniref:1044_t:CDS:1 n=1 Tax=Dentiscutata erythropus TaxID=1348616 RepID=A0A9N9FIY7_9GLOM|nr:1044_t:CDS:2 [Dentiscutata erythropus]
MSIEVDSDETIENFSESSKSIPAHFKTHSEAIYTSIKNTLKGYQKKELCLLKINNPNLTNIELANQFNISSNSVRDILKNSDHWVNLDLNSYEANLQRNKTPKFLEIEQALNLWVDRALNAKMTITGYTLIAQAQQFADILDITNFKASDGWLSNFKKRAGLREFNHHGEASSAPLENLPEYRNSLQNLLDE